MGPQTGGFSPVFPLKLNAIRENIWEKFLSLFMKAIMYLYGHHG